MNAHRLDELITAKLSGTLDKSGQQELAALLEQHPEWRTELGLLEQYWQSAPTPEVPAPGAFDKMMATALAPVETDNMPVVKRMRWWKWAAAAAVAGLLGALSYQAWWHSGQSAAGEALVATRNGERRQVILSDGSIVHLNASSRLTCQLNAYRREIWLEGEAYFEVAPDAARPFTVHAAHLNIHALGTAFNVKAYPGDALFETTLLQGAVEVYTDKTPDNKIRLRPYEKIAVARDQLRELPAGKLEIKPVVSKAVVAKAGMLPALDSTIRETAWVSNRLQFDSVNFQQLGILLERWYGVQIVFRNDAVKQYVFSGSFASESVTQALQALQLTEDFHFENKGTQIIIY
ncbi:FecR domain-containing protein [Chitinophaga sp. Ak27]|uniref:FecR domain-containing protein n=1 Tax=Chitinophaga sp. Ak27 TaxID=2726116 RepID=UPI00145C9939|nr:FecR domain-containing protein [Chitinophaga sp. Ak27]NLU90902.1 DUF4974 domain-containing protein [Chitinophaga sp. Ak27]